MTLFLLIFSAIVVTCIFFNRFSGKVGIPVLLFFLMLGLLCGCRYDEFASHWGRIVGDISTIALIFIMFYGGFGTRWKSARPVVVEAGLLATVGVALTALLVGLLEPAGESSDGCSYQLHRCGNGILHSPFPQVGPEE